MVGIITGKGPGIENSSLATLGSGGLLGTASVGQTQESVYVNAATGNLILTDVDEMLVGRGPDAVVARTYNSLGVLWDGDNGDQWRAGAYRRVHSLTGILNTANSTVTRTDWDGSETVYTWTADWLGTGQGAYVSTRGGGPYDTIVFDAAGDLWLWTDTNTGTTERFDVDAVDGKPAGRLLSRSDTDGNVSTYEYTGALLTRVSTSNGEYVELGYTGSQLTSLVTHSGTSTPVITRVFYQYDTLNRLVKVQVNLDPSDNSATAGTNYETSYTYDGSSQRIATISQNDRTQLAVTYETISFRVLTVAQVETGVGGSAIFRVTSFNYDTPGQTKITDPLGQVTLLKYDADGNMTQVVLPSAVPGQAAQVTDIVYQADGDIASISRNGSLTAFQYDGHGNRVLERDPVGNTISRTYGDKNELLTETAYITPDPDGAGAQQPSNPRVSRFVYDANRRLRYAVSAEGQVTEYRYNGYGQQTSVIQYSAATYDGAAFSDPTPAQSGSAAAGSANASNYLLVNNWVASLTSRSAAQRTDTFYDYRGNIARTVSYETLDVSGNGAESPSSSGGAAIVNGANATVTGSGDTFVIEKPSTGTASAWDTDARGTVAASGDFVLRISPLDVGKFFVAGLSTNPGASPSNTTIDYALRFNNTGSVARGNGGTNAAFSPGVTYVAGDKFWITRSGTTISYYKGATLADAMAAGAFYSAQNVSATLYFDSSLYSPGAKLEAQLFVGPSRLASTASVSRTDYVYDAAGRLLSRAVSGVGTESFIYDGLGRLISATDFTNSTKTIAYAAPGTGSTFTTTVTLANGLIQTSTYNRAGELISYAESGAGVSTATTNYTYDDLGRLKMISDPTGRKTIYFYDGVGRQVGEVDPDGSLVEFRYDIFGNRVNTVAYATKLTSVQLSTLVAGAADAALGMYRPLESADDRWSCSIYDKAQRLIETIDATGAVTRYAYDGTSRVTGVTSYANRLSQSDFARLKYHWNNSQDGSQWVHGSASVQQEGTQGGFNAYRFTLTANGAIALKPDVSPAAGYPVKVGDVVTMSFWVKAGSASTTSVEMFGIRGGTTTWGNGSEVTAEILSGPGTLDAGTTGRRSISGLSESEFTLVRVTRTIVEDMTMNPQIYIGSGTSSALAGDSIVIAGPTLSINSVTAAITPTGSTDDRASRNFYDDDGRLIGTRDAEGFVTEIRYDAAGRKIEQIAYSDPSVSSPDFQTVMGSVVPDAAADIHNYWVYDARGLMRAAISGEGEVTRFDYDAAGNLQKQTSGQRLSVTALATTPPTFANLAAPTATESLATITWSRDLFGDVLTETRSVTGSVTTTTTFSYDNMRRLVSTTNAASGAHARRYDSRGRLIGELDPQDTAALAALSDPTPAEIDAFYAANGWTFTYDKAGRLTSKRGPTASGQRTLYFYDGDGALAFEVNARGEVVEYRYDTFGSRTDTILHSGRVSASSWTPSTTFDTVQLAVSNLNDMATSNVAHATFGLDGLVASETHALGSSSSYTYNAFGEAETSTTALDDNGSSGASRSVETKFKYDRRGLVLTQTVDATGKNIKTSYQYDAFGRLHVLVNDLSSTPDEATTSEYYRNGLLKSVKDLFGNTTSYVYDGRGNLVGVTNAKGDVTRYAYDASNRRIATINALGEVVATTYDADGRVTSTREYLLKLITLPSLTSATLSDGTVALPAADNSTDRVTRYAYGDDGRLRFTIDGTMHLTEVRYDDAGNVVRVIAYGGTLPATTGSYDETWIEGQLATVSNDEDRITRSIFNTDGRALYEIDAAGKVSWNTYDTAGRLTKRVEYAKLYSAAGSPTIADMQTWRSSAAVTAEAADDRTTRFYYDANGQLSFSIDAAGAVTRWQYDKAGHVVAELRYPSIFAATDTTTLAGLIGSFATEPSGTRKTLFGYDSAGRLVQTTDPAGVVTTLELDELGRTKSSTRAAGVSGAEAKTIYTYDLAGRLQTVTVQVGATASSSDLVTTYHYDAVGNVDWTQDPAGNRTYTYYDQLGRKKAERDAENYVTEFSYNSFGEVSQVTRRANRASNAVTAYPTFTAAPSLDAITTFTYDRAGRLDTLTYADGNRVDGILQGPYYYEKYTYDAFGDRLTFRDKLGSITEYEYDKRGLLLREVKPVTTLRASDDAIISVENAYRYDAFGNVDTFTEAVDAHEQRVTSYQHDKLGRLSKVTHAPVTVVANDLSETTQTLSESTYYSARGNIVESVDAAGARTLYWYDAADRKTWSLSPMGTLTQFLYDASGNLEYTIVYETSIALPAASGSHSYPVPVPSDPTLCRVTKFSYDRLQRLVATMQLRRPTATTFGNLQTGQWNEATGQYVVTSADSVGTSMDYDSLGNLVRQNDGRGDTWSYFDKLGRKTAQVDQEGFLTVWERDADGNALKETRYAGSVAAHAIDATTSLTDLISWTGAATENRVTTFTYDRLGRRISETRDKVDYATVVASGTNAGTLTSVSDGSSTVKYDYNGIDQVLRKTEANGDKVVYDYDAAGRLFTETGQAFTDDQSHTVTPVTRYTFDGLNNLISTKVLSDSYRGSSLDRETKFTYDQLGRLATLTDANDDVREYGYDAAGRVVREKYARSSAGVAQSTVEAKVTHYDLAGRVITQTFATFSNNAWTFQNQSDPAAVKPAYDAVRTRYNAYGEVTGRGITAGPTAAAAYQETFDYDAGGRLWRSNAGDGALRFYVYDRAGNHTLTLESAGADLSALTATNYTSYIQSSGDATLADAVTTIMAYDLRNQLEKTIEVDRQLSSTARSTLTRSRSYNAFGEVASETDARNFVTTYEYNTMGRLVLKVAPQVSITSETGQVLTVSPTDHYSYDQSGRLVGVEDANGNLTTRLLLAGTGHSDDSPELVTREYHPDGGIYETKYDVFGDARQLINEEGKSEARSYDKLGRLITIEHAIRPANEAGNGNSATQLVDHYVFDELGQRIGHWNSKYGAGVVERTAYDAQGRVVSTIGLAGDQLTYSYLWKSGLTGMAATSGWEKITTNVTADPLLGRTSKEVTDYFGKTLDLIDFGGHNYNFAYDQAARLVGRSNNVGQMSATDDYDQDESVVFTYFNTGLVSGQTGTQGVATYAYDASGNRIKDTFEKGSFDYRNATASYDALNRIVAWADTISLEDANNKADVSWTYDAVGNIRTTEFNYKPMTASGSLSANSNGPIKYWFTYDKMNRVTINNGYLNASASRIDIAPSGDVRDGGTKITYYRDGSRKSALHYEKLQKQRWWRGDYGNYVADYMEYDGLRREDYVYTSDGYLADTYVTDSYVDPGQNPDVTGVPAEPVFYEPTPFGPGGDQILLAERDLDELGRVTYYHERSGVGLNQADIGWFERSSVSYDAAGRVTSEVSKSWKRGIGPSGELEGFAEYKTVTTNIYTGGVLDTQLQNTFKNDSDSAIPDSTMSYQYEWWDAQLQKKVINDTDNDWETTYSFDSSGHVTGADIDDGTPREVSYVTDQNGMIIDRTESSDDLVGGDPRQMTYRFSGVEIGYVTNNGTDNLNYTASINDRLTTPTWGSQHKPGGFRKNSLTPTPVVDFSESYEAINGVTADTTTSSYTIQGGETLGAVAQSVWGDSSLWYLIADANGLVGSETLLSGQVLVIPAKVHNMHNSSTTWRPYNPSEALGDTSPTSPKPQKPEGQCGGLGAMLVTMIAVAVTIYLTGPLSTFFSGPLGSTMGAVVGGAAAGGAGSLAGQVVGVATGVQDSLDWKGVALSALAGAANGALSRLGAFSGAGDAAKEGMKAAAEGGKLSNSLRAAAKFISAPNFAGGVARGVISSASTQGLARLAGLQGRFDFAGVAVAGVVGGTSSYLGAQLGVNWGGSLDASSIARQTVTGMAGAVAGAVTRSALTGGVFADTLLATLPDVIGNAAGSAFAGAAMRSGSTVSDLHSIQRASPDLVDASAFRGDGLHIVDGLKSLWENLKRVLSIPSHVDSAGDRDGSVSVDDIVVIGKRVADRVSASSDRFASSITRQVNQFRVDTAPHPVAGGSRFEGAVSVARPLLRAVSDFAYRSALYEHGLAADPDFLRGAEAADRRTYARVRAALPVVRERATDLAHVAENMAIGTYDDATDRAYGNLARASINVIAAPATETGQGMRYALVGEWTGDHTLAGQGYTRAGLGLLAVFGWRAAIVESSAVRAAERIGVVEDVAAWDRLSTVGRTPGKSSATGRAVIQRMEAEGKIMDDPVLGRMFKGSDEQWYPMQYGDMSHTTDAVSWWNATGRSYGAKAPEVRQWMLKSDNYVIDYYSINRSAGAKLGNSGIRYLPPLK